MRTHPVLLTSCAAALVLLLGLGPSASAQTGLAASPIKIKSLEAETIRTPDYSPRVSGVNTSSPKLEWMRVEAEFEVEPERGGRWLDEVTFVFFVVLKSKNKEDTGGKELNVFKGSVTYVNLPKYKLKSAMYLDPFTLARYGEVTHTAVQVMYRGSVVAEEANPRAARWWETQPALPLPLVDRSKTPFANVNPDDYPTLKSAPAS